MIITFPYTMYAKKDDCHFVDIQTFLVAVVDLCNRYKVKIYYTYRYGVIY